MARQLADIIRFHRKLQELKQARAAWEKLLAAGFLSEEMKEKYLHVLEDRFTRLYK